MEIGSLQKNGACKNPDTTAVQQATARASTNTDSISPPIFAPVAGYLFATWFVLSIFRAGLPVQPAGS